MIKDLPLFPLNLVCFPGEHLNLHVFEPRYKQLVNECIEDNSTFGIPAYINNRLELGTEVEVKEVTKRYKDGRLDIKTLGIAVFEVISYQNPAKDKLYSNGTVRIKKIDLSPNEAKLDEIRELMGQFYETINVENPFPPSTEQTSFTFAHKIGFSIDEEYSLLKMKGEDERLDFIIAHLTKTIPLVEEIENTKTKIAMNGHFKKLGPIDF
ncbi:MAG: LON peptidase substrate-binding domain-containing protein [Cyclobacteriaceae bacterium]